MVPSAIGLPRHHCRCLLSVLPEHCGVAEIANRILHSRSARGAKDCMAGLVPAMRILRNRKSSSARASVLRRSNLVQAAPRRVDELTYLAQFAGVAPSCSFAFTGGGRRFISLRLDADA